MYSRLARTTLLTASKLTPARPLVIVTTLSPHGLRSISTRPIFNSTSPYEDRAPYEARGTHPPFKPSLDYFTEAIIDFDNFRDLQERFEAAYKDGDSELLTAIANTLIHEVSMYSTGKELVVYKVLEDHGFEDLVYNGRRQLHEFRNAFIQVDTSVTSSNTEKFAESVRNACSMLLEYVKNEEKEQYEKLLIALTGPERAELASEYLKARKNAPKYLCPADRSAQRLIEETAKPIVRSLSGLRSFVEVKYKHSDPSLA